MRQKLCLLTLLLVLAAGYLPAASGSLSHTQQADQNKPVAAKAAAKLKEQPPESKPEEQTAGSRSRVQQQQQQSDDKGKQQQQQSDDKGKQQQQQQSDDKGKQSDDKGKPQQQSDDKGKQQQQSGDKGKQSDSKSKEQQADKEQQGKDQREVKAKQQAGEPNYGWAKGCVPPTLPEPEPLGVPIPALDGSRKPNFIVILTDDQGYDDLGLHQPQRPGSKPTWVSTPNLDKFFRRGTEFSNFYVSPMCSQSRAMLLTGRDYQRTGTMLINGGYDYINREEATAGQIFKGAGYDTAHFGKWHNGRTLGYEPWSVGFEESWLPSSHVHLDNLMRHNGEYVQTRGLMEQDLMDTMLGYLKNHESKDSKPFFVYYAPHAIHQGFLRPGQGPRWQRPAPEPYRSKYENMKPRLSRDTADVWAFLEYMDDVLGRLFDYVNSSPLRDNTYVMIMSDNGAELFPGERRGDAKLTRMPSGMQGFKKSVEEGGVRNFLAVQGPGVPGGIIDNSLLSITDILPTAVQLAGISANHLPWDGISFANLLQPGAAASRSVATLRLAGRSQANQVDRYIVEMGPECWAPDSVAALGSDRKVLRPQPLLDYDKGGVDGQGFQRCLGVRYLEYKWLGATNKVYRFNPGNSHIELPCNEVTGPERDALVRELSGVARQHFAALAADDHSFSKPTFFLGLDQWTVTNVLPDGAHERTEGRIELLPNGAAGFARFGDSMCFKIKTMRAGTYKVTIMYTSQVQATFRLAYGTYADIVKGTAKELTGKLPVMRNMKGRDMGELQLSESGDRATETCLFLVSSSSLGSPVFDNLSNIRFSLVSGGEERQAKESNKKRDGGFTAIDKQVAGAGSEPQFSPEFAMDWISIDDSSFGGDVNLHPNLGATAAMKQVERDARAVASLNSHMRQAKESAVVTADGQPPSKEQLRWEELRQLYGWPQGQMRLESMFSPYESEGIDRCSRCQPGL